MTLAAADLALQLVRYDRELAEAVLRAAKSELDGQDEAGKTTREWKEGLGHAERLRGLCESLEELLA